MSKSLGLILKLEAETMNFDGLRLGVGLRKSHAREHHYHRD
jgi:hypothetical protein